MDCKTIFESKIKSKKNVLTNRRYGAIKNARLESQNRPQNATHRIRFFVRFSKFGLEIPFESISVLFEKWERWKEKGEKSNKRYEF